MRLTSKLVLLVSLALAAMALAASTAAATTIAEVGDVVGTENGAGVLTGTLAVTCDTSTIKLTVKNNGDGTVDDVTWAACTSGLGGCTVTLDTKVLAGHVTGIAGGGELTLNAVTGTATISCGIATCTATVDTTLTGTVTNSSKVVPVTGAQLSLVAQDVGMPGGLCGTLGTWTQSWTVNSTANGADSTVTVVEP